MHSIRDNVALANNKRHPSESASGVCRIELLIVAGRKLSLCKSSLSSDQAKKERKKLRID